jgi:LPXTG-motif cell wall-anchored protein
VTWSRRALVALVVGVVVLSAGPVAGEGERMGAAVIVDPGGAPIAEGGSATAFTFQLPTGAACPGDSANDDYRIQSFIVPDDVDPAGLTYESTKPAGDGNWSLYEVNSNNYVQALTAVAVNPGDPGIIDAIPPLDFAVFPPGTLAEGVNRVGIACSLFNETVQFWDTEVVLTNDPADRPAELTWEAVGAPDSSGSSSNVLPWVGLGVAVLAAAGGVVVLRRRRPAESRR